MNSQKQISSLFRFNSLCDSDCVSQDEKVSSGRSASQFLSYKQASKQMKENLDNSSYSDSDMIVLVCDSSSEEKQSESENENSSSYYKRFNESWIRII